ncbi:MAG TPA: peptidylprolyl isomerase [Pyrinomonadaceae bacterium]
MLFRKIVLTTLAAAALPFTAQAQTRPTRRAPARPAAGAAKRPAATAARTPAAAGVNITAADMSLVVEGLGLGPRERARIAESAEERRAFAKDVRRVLAAAEEAKAAGYLARPELKLQTELARSFIIAQGYFDQRKAAGATGYEQVVTPAEIDAYFNEAAVPAQFEAFVQDYSKNSPLKGKPVPEETRKGLRGHYGRVMVAMRKGVAAGVERERKTQLAILLQQSKLLAGAYEKETAARFKPTDAEVDAYVATHPELNTRAERDKTERVLALVRAGGDFATLADEYTDDPSGKGRGGDLGWFGRGMMVKPFEDAAFALKPGEVSGVIETVFGYHIVKLDERRAQGAGEEVRARHILITYKKQARGPDGQLMLPREKAAAEVEEQKRNRALDEAAARRRVQVAEEYVIGSPASDPPRPAPAGGAASKPPPAPKPAATAKSPAPSPPPARKAPARRKP